MDSKHCYQVQRAPEHVYHWDAWSSLSLELVPTCRSPTWACSWFTLPGPTIDEPTHVPEWRDQLATDGDFQRPADLAAPFAASGDQGFADQRRQRLARTCGTASARSLGAI